MWTWETLPGWSFYILVGFWLLLGDFFWHSLKPMYWWRWLEDSSLNPTFHTSKSWILKMTICRWKMWFCTSNSLSWWHMPNSVSAYLPSGLQASHQPFRRVVHQSFARPGPSMPNQPSHLALAGCLFVPSRPSWSLAVMDWLVDWLVTLHIHGWLKKGDAAPTQCSPWKWILASGSKSLTLNSWMCFNGNVLPVASF